MSTANRQWKSNQLQGKWYCIADIEEFLDAVQAGHISWNVKSMRKKGTVLPYDLSLTIDGEEEEKSPCFVLPLDQKERMEGRDGEFGQYVLCTNEGYECFRDKMYEILADPLEQLKKKHEECILITDSGEDTRVKWPWKADVHDTIAELQDSKTSYMTVMLDSAYANETEGTFGPSMKLSQFKKRPFTPKKIKKEPAATFEAEPAPVETKKRRAK